jgi:hypothetical protein
MPISAVAAGVSIAAGATSIGTSIANEIGGGGPGPVSGQTGGSSSNITSQQYTYYGPHISTSPMGQSMEGSPPKQQPEMTAPKAIKGQAASPISVPTHGAEENAASAKTDFNNIWADRLSRYLDYNSRQLGFICIFNKLDATLFYITFCVIVYYLMKLI